jgi:transcriptional antiterminator RfaH
MSELQGWLVVMTKPKMEIEAKEHLVRQGYEVYLPLWVDLRRQPGGWQKVQTAMFPRYLFTRTSYGEQSVSPIRSTRGVSRLVRFGMKLARVSGDLIEEIRVLEAVRNDSGNELKPFKNGDQVLVMDGPFKGVTAEVLSSDQQRVILLLQVLGKIHQLEFGVGLCLQR